MKRAQKRKRIIRLKFLIIKLVCRALKSVCAGNNCSARRENRFAYGENHSARDENGFEQ